MYAIKTEREPFDREIQPRLLVLDADPQVRETVSKSLSNCGCLVYFEGSPDLFENILLKVAHFDVVLIDLFDPVERPFEMLSIIKENSPRTEVIFISNLAEVPLWIESMQRGAYDYLPKPLNRQELRRVIRGALGKNAAHCDLALPSQSPGLRLQDSNL
jgi:DNA-binding NtrC family response regulator